MQILSHLVFAAAEYLRALGCDPAELARRVGLPAEVISAPSRELPLDRQTAFFELAAEVTRDPHFGLSVAEHRSTGGFGLVEFLLRSSASVQQGFERASRYFSILNPASTFAFAQVGDDAEVRHSVAGSPTALGRHANELTVASMIRVAFEITGQRTELRGVWFANPPPQDLSRLETFFHTRSVRFDAGSNGVRIPATVLQMPLAHADPALASFLEHQAQEKARSLPSPDDLVGRVEDELRRALPDGAPNLERIAIRLGLSARTLQRRLDERGTRFADLLEQLREKLAREYVRDETRRVTEIAFLLGYSDVTTFLRAFKRWTGKTPGELRRAREP